MKRIDMAYYVGWLTLLILLGIWMLIWALGAVRMGEALFLWLLSTGIMLIAIGGFSGKRAASGIQLGAGLILTVFAVIMLAMVSDIMGGFVGAALGIILIGIIGFILLFRKIKLED